MQIYNEKEKSGQREIYHVQIDNMEKQGLLWSQLSYKRCRV